MARRDNEVVRKPIFFAVEIGTWTTSDRNSMGWILWTCFEECFLRNLNISFYKSTRTAFTTDLKYLSVFYEAERERGWIRALRDKKITETGKAGSGWRYPGAEDFRTVRPDCRQPSLAALSQQQISFMIFRSFFLLPLFCCVFSLAS